MTQLASGSFLGTIRDRSVLDGAALTLVSHAAPRSLPTHTHESAYFSLLLRGGYSESAAGRSIAYAPLTLVFHPPGMTHSDEVTGPDSVFFLIEVGSAWLESLNAIPRASAADVSLLRDGTGDALALYRAHRSKAMPQLDAEERLWTMLAGVSRAEIIRERAVPAWLGRIVERLHDDFRSSLTVAELAAGAGVHPVHLARTFRSRLRLTMGEYLNRIRVSWVIGELSRGRTLADLAYEAGFADQSHMSRVCSAMTGAPPKALRKLLTESV